MEIYGGYSMEMGTNLLTDIETVVDYLWKDEERHY
jgi:hypothetical protein